MVAAWRDLGIDADLVGPATALRRVGPGDVVVNRLDVRGSLDGVEPGLDVVLALERSGARIVNPPHALVAAHDKLATAGRLADGGVPHPRTIYVPSTASDLSDLDLPVVMKPRFGSWGRDVMLCRTSRDLGAALTYARSRSWFRRHGAIAQAFVPHAADLRLVLAGGRLVGAIERRPAHGEWRTNFSLGGSRRPVVPPPEALRTAEAAVAAVGADFVGVDLIAVPDGYVVLELNGSVDFDRLYSLPGRDAYIDAAVALGLPVAHTRHAPYELVPRGRPSGLPVTSWREASWV